MALFDRGPEDGSSKHDGSDPYYLTSSGCPYGRAFPADPERLSLWEEASNRKLEDGWKADGAELGVGVNDHNWVKLGQGNTLGLVAGSLAIGRVEGHDLAALPHGARVGLFSDPGLHPAIVRFSDFGADRGSQVERLGRMAIKVSYPDAWCGEINLTTAETIEQFSLANFDEIACFVGDPERSGLWRRALFKARKAMIALHNARALGKEWRSGELLSKTYYSQLAYLCGPDHCFKYRFVPMQNPVADVEDTVEAARQAVRDWLGVSEAKFELQIQLRSDPDSELVQRKARDRWSAPWIPVGLLRLARQKTDDDGMGVALGRALRELLELSGPASEWLHKSLMFHPLLTAEEHLPVGETQQFRSHFYPVATQQRLKLFSQGAIHPVTVPLSRLVERSEIAPLFDATTSAMPSVAERYFRRMDPYTRALCELIPPKVVEANRNALTDLELQDSELDLFGPQKSSRVGVGDLDLTIIEEDDTFGDLGLKPWLLLKVLRDKLLFPMQDVVVDCEVEELAALKQRLGLVQSMPQPTHKWEEMSSDEAMSRVYFYGTGAVTLEEVHDGETRFVADTGWLRDLEVRPDFRPYGARVHFSEDQRLLSIHDYAANRTLRPGDDGWAHVKHLAKQSLAMSVTGVQHLLWSHFGVANGMVNAAVTHLPLDHPMRRLLGPFLFRTVLVNNRAKDSLLPRHSMFHHATALTYPSVIKLLERGYRRCDFWKPFPKVAQDMGPALNDLANDGRAPYIQDGMTYFDAVRRFVGGWVSEAYSDDATLSEDAALQAFWSQLAAGTKGMKYELPPQVTRTTLVDTLAQFIFVATGLHEVVGAVVEYTDLEFCGFRARPGATRNDLQSWLIVACLMSTTSIRTPGLMGSSFPNYFKSGFEANAWSAFQADLQAVAELNDSRNASRLHPFLGFNPSILECSISV